MKSLLAVETSEVRPEGDGAVPFSRVSNIALHLVASGLIGVFVALVAAAFVWGTRFFTELHARDPVLIVPGSDIKLHLSVFFGLVAAAGVLFVLRRVFAIERWHGPADAIFAAHSSRNEIDARHGFGSTLAAFVSASGGASVGQYGPLVHFGATLGSSVRRALGGRFSSDILIGSGVAAAISAGFGAPLAGIVFAHEAVIRHFSFRAIGAIALSSVVAAAVSTRVFAPPRMMPVELANTAPLHDLIVPMLVAGLVFGVVAVAFMRGIREAQRLNRWLGWSWERSICAAVLGLGLIGAVLPQVMGLGTSVLMQIIEGDLAVGLLVLILIGKILATSLSLGFGFFGGVFSPALLIGAAAGALFAHCLGAVGLAETGAVMVMAGMAAVSAAVVGAPLATVLIVLELTRSYDYALASLLAVAVATLVSHVLFGHSFFDRQLLDRRIDISFGRSRLNAEEIEVRSFVSHRHLAVAPGTTVETVVAQLVGSGMTEAYCVGPGNVFLGKLHLTRLLGGDASRPVVSLADPAPLSLLGSDSLSRAMTVATGFVGESIPVLDPDTGGLMGVVAEADIFAAFVRMEAEIHRLEHA